MHPISFSNVRRSITRVKTGQRIPPHWHPDEVRTVVVLSGTLYFGSGDKWDESKFKAYPAGTFYSWLPHHRSSPKQIESERRNPCSWTPATTFATMSARSGGARSRGQTGTAGDAGMRAMRKICAVLCFGIGVAFAVGALYSLLTESLFRVVAPGLFAAIFLLSSFFLSRRSKG
jgi:hypothetical protein